jgi:hypothetical protein
MLYGGVIILQRSVSKVYGRSYGISALAVSCYQLSLMKDLIVNVSHADVNILRCIPLAM